MVAQAGLKLKPNVFPLHVSATVPRQYWFLFIIIILFYVVFACAVCAVLCEYNVLYMHVVCYMLFCVCDVMCACVCFALCVYV